MVDGVAAGVVFAVALARLGLKTSKAGGYAAPGPKAYSGLFARFSPKRCMLVRRRGTRIDLPKRFANA